ncbi:MAG: ATP-binding cassette domain-containing protein [Candidatus Bathyarchaeia archaeon]|jgi:ABC-2 type transport system ATP-binding protein
MSDIIMVEDLVEIYPDGTRAIDGVSFNIKQGEFFGFLGPNGAGKSTVIKILTTLLEKTSGVVTVAGYDVETAAKEIRKVIGVQSQYTIVDDDLTGRENLVLQGHLQRMHGTALDQRVNELLGIVGLLDVADKRALQYSVGMKRRLDLASALVHKPKLLFLDEPTIGLDPQARAEIWKYLEELNKTQGTTIFLTTQYLEEADRLCQRLSIIDHGQIIVSGSPTELKQQISEDTITISLGEIGGTSDLQKAKKVASGISGVMNVLETDHGLTLYVKNAEQIVPNVVRAFDRNNLPLVSVKFSSPSLDDVFLQQTGRRIRPEELQKKPTYAFAKMPKRRKIPFH